MKKNVTGPDENIEENKKDTKNKKSSTTEQAGERIETSTDHVQPRSTTDVNGRGGLRNTGTNVSYEDE